MHISTELGLGVEAEETMPGWLYRCQGSFRGEEKLIRREGG